jgi:cellulose synthase/poly-beta-1,6-N-acetylglucosamine synthase-like glycosyltransferase
MLSVIIPVWRESSLLDNLISDLAKDPYKDKEIIVTIDEPTSKSKTLVQKYADVKFLLNENRMGKVNALNEASQLANGDLLMFLDADTTLKTKNILSKVEQQMDSTVDILEFKKEVEKENFISKLVSYDYIGGIVCSLLFNRLKRCLGLNGSGFVITRQFFNEVGGFKNVISEDLEMGMQAFLRSKTYK